MWCLVNLPNGTTSGVQCDPKRISQECLEKVCADLGIICETDYFGLIPVRVGDNVAEVDECSAKQWINLRNPLNLYTNDRAHPLLLSLRVKFWVPAHLILQSSVRALFYMQARQELFDGHLRPSSWTNAAYLAALLLQADGIKYDPAKVPQLTESDETNSTATVSAASPAAEATDVTATDRRPTLQQNQQQQQQQLRRPSKRKCSEIECKRGSVSSQSSTTPPTGWHLDDLGRRSRGLSPVTPTTSGGGEELSKAPKAKNIYHQYGALRPAFEVEEEDGEEERSQVVQQQESPQPDDYYQLIAREHEKLSLIKMSATSAQYWLLEEICSLIGYGEEIFEGVTIAEPSVVCKIGVSPHGLTIVKDEEKYRVSFTAVKAAKSIKRSFRLTYVNEHHEETHVELKLPNHRTAASLYRAITEKHVFYSCETVRPIVTTQFIRDLKGTIVSMFNEDTELGKRYVFDIQRTCREVYDAARRTLHARGIEISNKAEEHKENPVAAMGRLEETLRTQRETNAQLERLIDERIREAITCPICADGVIDTTFLPCGHMTACRACAVQCDRCPLCRSNIKSISKIFLPPLLRSRKSTIAQGGSGDPTCQADDEEQEDVPELSKEHTRRPAAQLVQ